MKLRKNYIAINIWLLLLIGLQAHAAQVAGTVTDLNGPLLAKKADGTVKVLSQKSLVEQGDLLVTEKETYARIKFLDNSEVTLRPGTQFRIDKFSYEENKPQDDSALFSLLKGGLRAVSGTVGKRSRERTSLNTPTATIGIRGTIYIAEYVAPESADVAAWGRTLIASAGDYSSSAYVGGGAMHMSDSMTGMPVPEILPAKSAQHPIVLAQAVTAPTAAGRAPPGLYVQVLDGMIHLTNNGGAQSFAAGQFGYAPSLQQPPVIIPANPGMQFSPPPAFSSTSGTASTKQASGPAAVNCEVR